MLHNKHNYLRIPFNQLKDYKMKELVVCTRVHISNWKPKKDNKVAKKLRNLPSPNTKHLEYVSPNCHNVEAFSALIEENNRNFPMHHHLVACLTLTPYISLKIIIPIKISYIFHNPT